MPANTALVASALLALALPATARPHSHLHSHLHARLQQAPLAKRSSSYGYDTTGYDGYDGYGGYGYGHAGYYPYAYTSYYPYGYSGHGNDAYAYGFPAALDFNRQFDRTTNRADFHDTTVFANNKDAHVAILAASIFWGSSGYGYGYGYGHAGYYPYGYSGHGYGAYAYGFPAALDLSHEFDRTTNRADFHDTTVFANNKDAHVTGDTVHNSASKDFVG
ncbi:hypothetical protein GQ54DRAFT_326372 [Martensiomyces pterosporus]|nr:hypothetical protein GQ54DRAFT_326372 [Martensiomyces pterosporus]